MVFSDKHKNTPPTTPVIPSQSHAEAEFKNWLKQNDIRSFTDYEGLAWGLSLKLVDIPATPPQAWGRQVRLDLRADLGKDHYIEIGLIDPAKDKRLLTMLGDRLITIKLKTQTLDLRRDQEVATQLSEWLPTIRSALERRSYVTEKKRMLHTWLNRSMSFAGSSLRPAIADPSDRL